VQNATAGLPDRDISYRRVCNPTEAMSEQVTDVPPRKEPRVGRKRSIMGLGSASSCTQNAFEHAICAACNALFHGYRSSLSLGLKTCFIFSSEKGQSLPTIAHQSSRKFEAILDEGGFTASIKAVPGNFAAPHKAS